MSILSKFKKLFASGSDDITDEQPSYEPKGIDESPEEIAIKKEKNNYELKDILKNEEVKKLILELYEVYKKESTSDFIKSLIETENKIVKILPTINLPDTFKSDLTNVIISTFSTKDDENILGIFEENLKFNINPLVTLLDFLDTLIEEYQKYPTDITAFIQNVIHKDINKFFDDMLPIVQYYRSFKIQATTEISNDKKQKFIDAVNDFISEYDKDINHINKLFRDYKETESKRSALHTSVIGGNGGF